MYQLYPFQEENVKYILSHRYVQVADEMGLGKSLTAIDVINRTGKQAVIVCPAMLKTNWKNEVKKFLDKEALVVNHINYLDSFDYDIVILNYENLAKYYFVFENRSIFVVDESHYLKNMQTKRTEIFHHIIALFPPEYLILLSGTPIKNRVVEFYSTLKLLSNCPDNLNGHKIDHYFLNFSEFCNHFAYPVKKLFNGRVVTTWEGLKNVEDLKKLLFGKYIRHLCKDNLNLPELIEIPKRVDVAIPKDLEQDLQEAFLNAEFGLNSQHISTIKCSAAMVKAATTAYYCKELIDQGEYPLVIFSDHVESSETIFKILSATYQGGCITGKVVHAERDKILAAFHNSSLKFLVATIGACSVGLTLTEARHCIFNDLSWVPADLEQAKKRIHRIGQKRTSFVHYLLAGEVDEMIFRTIHKKLGVINHAV